MITLNEVISATCGIIVSKGDDGFSGVSIDSRTIKSGELFIALKGERFDGHDFLDAALQKGSGAIIEKSRIEKAGTGFKDRTIIGVEDTLRALQNLAGHFRKDFNGHVFGVVGSNGKTTTKEMLSSILSKSLSVLKTEGNLNNHIGMPLSIINGTKKPDVMVLEMGTNRPGDIDELCRICLPDIGVITNIGYEHIEGFGSLDRVRDSELEILPYIKRLIVNADDSFLMQGVRKNFKGEIITFGIENRNSDITARDIVFSDEGISFVLHISGESIDINTKMRGYFNVYNCLAASSAAYSADFGLREIKEGLESFVGVRMRFEILKYGGITFLNDAYNANPSSMEESLKELIRMLNTGKRRRYKRAIAVLGDMLELGDYATKAHINLGQRMSDLPVDIFIGVGPLMSLAVSEFNGNGIHVNSSEDASKKLKEIIRKGDVVLIKGSRGMKMEKVFESMESRNVIRTAI